jgi:hypothetical protein
MSKLPGWPLCPKQEFMMLHTYPEYLEGTKAPKGSTNPYDFWDNKQQYSSWDMGNQERGKK